MVEEVEQKQRAIEELNRGPEEKVRVTHRGPHAGEGRLERAYEELSQAEMNLIHSEKMASLGQLVAASRTRSTRPRPPSAPPSTT
jgi:hypothetical protein